MAGTYTQLHFHVVFAVKHRLGLLASAWRPRLFSYISGIVEHPGHKLLGIGGVEDHIHIAFGMRPAQALSNLVADIKRGSSRWINDAQLTPGHFEWQEGYGAFSYSRSQLPDLLRYIENQEHHHQTEDFLTEYRRILDRFEVPYDERYLFNPPL
jgi:putative transposase